MKRNILVLICGLLLGVGATVYFLGRPGGRSLAGVPVKPPDSSKETSGTVTVTIDEKFFDSLLGTLFQKLGPPQLKLSQNEAQTPARPAFFQDACNDVVMLAPEDGDVKTAVRFTGGQKAAPNAFSRRLRIVRRCPPV